MRCKDGKHSQDLKNTTLGVGLWGLNTTDQEYFWFFKNVSLMDFISQSGFRENWSWHGRYFTAYKLAFLGPKKVILSNHLKCYFSWKSSDKNPQNPENPRKSPDTGNTIYSRSSLLLAWYFGDNTIKWYSKMRIVTQKRFLLMLDKRNKRICDSFLTFVPERWKHRVQSFRCKESIVGI